MIKFSEEFKEALLKAKDGKTVFVLGKNEDGSWEVSLSLRPLLLK